MAEDVIVRGDGGGVGAFRCRARVYELYISIVCCKRNYHYYEFSVQLPM